LGLKALLEAYFIDLLIFISKKIWQESIHPYLCTPFEKRISSLKENVEML